MPVATVPQLPAWIQAQFLGEARTGLPNDRQRLGAQAAAVQGEHQLPHQALTDRVGVHRVHQLVHDATVLAAAQPRVEQILLQQAHLGVSSVATLARSSRARKW
ncbi:MAG TPA: hypothetical protein VFC00_00045 [Micromonosporaceae bacterium]|nr:hypothetical protein [Micromonosporaceae bacterium]